ncbi:BatA domain-containing protein [Paraglaciecola hydrolytica]|uniref:Aerotolerance regulator N-terminal domain-containing protein n=1 Tax=Paraglaciecola hydrolytica TaxID=1799789 RepID=A0A136A052_9ALTE|nr:BatA domain-containing protein [Paraglaciecola hydrolytica]KXI28626.1 hypothetical protein AX660_16200 [Paraglaciecola hydrolytica]
MNESLGLLWQQPWYALTALAVLIPIIIHLLNRSRGKLVTFAHVALLRNTKPQPTSELRLTQRVLLLLRLLMLLTAAALLSSPFWPPSQSETEVIMLTQDWLNNSNKAEKQQIATRLGKQQAILLDSPATLSQELSEQDILNWQTQKSQHTLNIWAKVQSHALGRDAQTPLVVYTSNRASQFVGEKVALTQPIDWQVLNINNNSAPEPLAILLIYQNDRQRDASYINAALSALQKQSAMPIQVSTLTETAFAQTLTNNVLPQAQLILWLSSAPLAPELVAHSTDQNVILMDAPQISRKDLWQLAYPTLLLAELKGDVLATAANPAFNAELSEVLWQTSLGLPLLSQLNIKQTKLLQFYSRFNPDWNTLVELPTFPLILGEWLYKAIPEQQKLARQVIEQQQITAKPVASQPQPTRSISPNSQQHSSLMSLLAILLLILFSVERIYSKKSRSTNITTVDGGQ